MFRKFRFLSSLLFPSSDQCCDALTCPCSESSSSCLHSSFLQTISAVMLWPVLVQKVPQASQHLLILKQSCDWPAGDSAPLVVVVCCLLTVPSTCWCISGTDLFRQLFVLPHCDGSCKSKFLSRPVTVY